MQTKADDIPQCIDILVTEPRPDADEPHGDTGICAVARPVAKASRYECHKWTRKMGPSGPAQGGSKATSSGLETCLVTYAKKRSH